MLFYFIFLYFILFVLFYFISLHFMLFYFIFLYFMLFHFIYFILFYFVILFFLFYFIYFILFILFYILLVGVRSWNFTLVGKKVSSVFFLHVDLEVTFFFKHCKLFIDRVVGNAATEAAYRRFTSWNVKFL
jgi:hypothetical protein